MKRHSTMLHAQQAEAAKQGSTLAPNPPAHRSRREGGKEPGYGG